MDEKLVARPPILWCVRCGDEMVGPGDGPWQCLSCLEERYPHAWRVMADPRWTGRPRPFSPEEEIVHGASWRILLGRVRDIRRTFPGPELRGGSLAVRLGRASDAYQINLYPDLPWQLGAAERCERERAAHDEMKTHGRCGGCGARLGEIHTPGCSYELCGYCGRKWLSCDCPIRAGQLRVPWRGWKDWGARYEPDS